MAGGGGPPAGPVTFKAPTGKSKLPGVLIAAFAAFGGVLFGYDTGYIAGVKAMPYWLQLFGKPSPPGSENPYFLDTVDNALITSILSAGTFAGALMAYPVGDMLGRRFGIIFSCFVFSIGVALQTASVTLTVFSVGRVFAGLGVGLVSCLVPLYQSESAPKWCRGGIVACYQWAITIGLLIAAIAVNATKDINSTACYRIPIGIQLVWGALLSAGLYFLPESPRYLILKGRHDDARRSLSRLLSSPPESEEVQTEYLDIASNLEVERDLGSSSYIDCFRRGPGKNCLRTCTGIALQAWQQLSGINFIFYFGTTFFQQAGISNAFTISIVTNIVNVLATIPGIWGVDKFGRRSLLLIGAGVMTVSEFVIAICGTVVHGENKSGQQVLIAFTCVFLAAFAATWGPIAWVVTGEIYPLGIRAKAMSMSTASNWLWNFIIGYITPYLVDSGPGKAALGSRVFFVWGSTCAASLAFVYFFVPETKGLSLEQVDLLYQNSTVRGANQYRVQLLSQGSSHPAIVRQRSRISTAGGSLRGVEAGVGRGKPVGETSVVERV